jgi:hypothetical protein
MRYAWTSRFYRACVVLACATGVVFASSCADDATANGEGSSEALNGNKSDDTATGTLPTPDPLDGSYRLELTSEVTTQEPGGFFSGPTEETSTTRLFGVVTVDAQASELGLSLQFCSIELPEVSGYVPKVEQATIRSLMPLEVRGERFETAELTTFETAQGAWVIGASLSEPLTEVLPADGDDPRVIDVEQDGEPGVTMTLENWNIYGAMRLLFRLQGSVQGEGKLAGQAEIGMDTAVFGDTVPLINVATSLANTRAETTIIDESHQFEMTRLSMNAITCAQAFDGEPIPDGTSRVGDSTPIDDEDPETESVPVVVGGPCVIDSDCVGTGATCLGAPLGFPEGHCSTSCEGICPPQGDALPSVCTPIADQGAWCLSGCSGPGDDATCRGGYLCGSVELVGLADTQVYACSPSETSTEPGETTPPAPVEDCIAELIERGVGFELAASPDEAPPGYPDLLCTIEDAVMVDGTLGGVNFRYASPDATVNRVFASCELALAMHDTAVLAQAQGVTDIVHLGAYNCRTISGTSTISQHGLGKAIDIAGVRLEDGTYWTVVDDWEDGVMDPETFGGQWLQWFANQLYAQWIFNMILTPEYDDYHDDHLHCDLSPGEHELH